MIGNKRKKSSKNTFSRKVIQFLVGVSLACKVCVGV